MEAIESLCSINPQCCRVASAFDAVQNSECVYTFHSPYTTDQGILVNLESFAGTVDAMAMLFGSSQALFVRIVKRRVEKELLGDDGEPAATATVPTKLAIGVEGGFATEDSKYETISTYSVVALEKGSNGTVQTLAELTYSDDTKDSFPEAVQKGVDSVIHHAGVSTQQQVQEQWAGEEIPVSKYCENLPFVDNGVMIDPDHKTWKCEKTGATENLWLNLSDGFVGGGRKHWDGSGGSNGALDHFKETGEKYPLVVKLGTITADIATADCYSYAPDEDGPVKIPNLAVLLEKRGIKQLSSLQKTVKSTAELEVELNQNFAFDAITEAGEDLQPVSGPSLQGLQNLGNSCYMNSVFQLLLSGTVPELAKRYGCAALGDITQHPFLRTVASTIAPTDVLCQSSKLACALTSGVFAKAVDNQDSLTDPKYRLAPRMMKHCIGKDHVDFKTGEQQDAAQFLQYYLERLDRAEKGATATAAKKHVKSETLHSTSHLFSFQTTARIACSVDGKVKYKNSAPETIWSLRIPMDKAKVAEESTWPEQKKLKPADDNKEAQPKPVPSIALATCLDEWAADTTMDGLRWPHLGNAVHSATQTLRLANFPRYLIVQLQRYELATDWTPIKLEVNVEVPEDLDLTKYKSSGPNDCETLAPDEDEDMKDASPSASSTVIDETALSQLMDMGFSLNSCKRALHAVGGSNVEAAMGWVFEHNADPDFNDPLPDSSDSMGSTAVDESVVQSLVASLGAFTAEQVRAALKETSGEADRAADWLFSHMDDLDGAIAALSGKGTCGSGSCVTALEDAEVGKYTLTGMISHIGKNTGSGHYVAHLKKDGKWVIFNDEKVALSSKPPFQHAYLYLFQRTDTIQSPSPNY